MSDVRYSDWQPVDPAQVGAPVTGPVTTFAHNIRIDRPHDDYRLDLQVTKIVLNSDVPADRFKLEQPTGSELVNVVPSGPGEGTKQQ